MGWQSSAPIIAPVGGIVNPRVEGGNPIRDWQY